MADDPTIVRNPTLTLNVLSEEQYQSIPIPSDQEIYLTPDDTDEKLAGKQDKLVEGTNITLVDNPNGTTTISSTAQESFFRGRWTNWSNVPSNSNLYPEDYHGNRTPTNNDYMVVSDASAYVPDLSNMPRVELRNMRLKPDGVQGASICDVYYYPDGINEIITYDFDCINNGIYRSVADGKVLVNWWYGKNWTIKANATVYYNESYYNSGDEIYNGGNRDTIKIYFLDSVNTYEGSWRFMYVGTWATDGKLGWIPEYQLENVLPIATDSEPGIAKLYTTTGQNTDGSMTQKSITDALNRIQDSCFRGSWNTWNDVPTVDTLYPEDWKYSHTPTYNDYMVVNDATGYVPSDLLTVELIVTQMNNSDCYYTIGSDTYHKTRQSGQNAPFGPNNEMSWNTLGEGSQGTRITFNDQVKYQNRVYNAGESIVLPNAGSGYNVDGLPKSFFIKRNVETLTGAWRFSYQGVWATDGKSGWVEEYQIENTLPEATSTIKGIAKLYTTTGSNTDGSMDQNSITTALGTKQNTLTAGNNITIDANSKIDAADKTLVSFVIWEDDTPTPGE